MPDEIVSVSPALTPLAPHTTFVTFCHAFAQFVPLLDPDALASRYQTEAREFMIKAPIRKMAANFLMAYGRVGGGLLVKNPICVIVRFVRQKVTSSINPFQKCVALPNKPILNGVIVGPGVGEAIHSLADPFTLIQLEPSVESRPPAIMYQVFVVVASVDETIV